jgi:hypothetical protein
MFAGLLAIASISTLAVAEDAAQPQAYISPYCQTCTLDGGEAGVKIDGRCMAPVNGLYANVCAGQMDGRVYIDYTSFGIYPYTYGYGGGYGGYGSFCYPGFHPVNGFCSHD